MPYHNVYVPAEVFMTYKDVTIYHVYVNDNPAEGVREMWFDTHEDSHDEEGFYLPDLEAQLKALGHNITEEGSYRAGVIEDEREVVVRAAISAGLLVSARRI